MTSSERQGRKFAREMSNCKIENDFINGFMSERKIIQSEGGGLAFLLMATFIFYFDKYILGAIVLIIGIAWIYNTFSSRQGKLKIKVDNRTLEQKIKGFKGLSEETLNNKTLMMKRQILLNSNTKNADTKTINYYTENFYTLSNEDRMKIQNMIK